MKTKITAILLATAILFSFAACGKTEADTTTSATTTVQTTIQTGVTTAAETTTVTETSQTQTDSRTGADTTAKTTVPTTKASTQATTTVPAVKTFTKADLATFDGKNGAASYLAYDGTVYDVSNVKVWESGSHFGLYVGTDITVKVKSCTKHVISFFDTQFKSYPKVGTYTG